MNGRWKRIQESYSRFVDGKGFGVIVTLCVAVITATAIWTGDRSVPYTAPTPPMTEDQHASVLMQQTLQTASTPTPLPSSSSPLWCTPLPEISILQAFSPDDMVFSSVTGMWMLHEAVDLKADLGEPVYAMADGTVTACGDDALSGSWIQIQHDGQYLSSYAGLSMLSALHSGDSVRAGQTIGFAGNAMIAESDLGPHVHIQLLQHDEPVDPMAFIQ